MNLNSRRMWSVYEGTGFVGKMETGDGILRSGTLHATLQVVTVDLGDAQQPVLGIPAEPGVGHAQPRLKAVQVVEGDDVQEILKGRRVR